MPVAMEFRSFDWYVVHYPNGEFAANGKNTRDINKAIVFQTIEKAEKFRSCIKGLTILAPVHCTVGYRHDE